MPAPRIPMRNITEVLRLKYDAGLSHEKIARACGLSKGVVSKYVSLAQEAGISWPLPDGTDEAALEARLFPAFKGLTFRRFRLLCGPNISYHLEHPFE